MRRLARLKELLLVVTLALGVGVYPCCAPAHADMPAQADTTEAYALGSDDVIEVTVLNHSELDRTFTVLPDGKITFPTVGELQAAGKTPRAFALEIQKELEKTLNNVSVTVSVKEVHSRRVRVVGAARQTGGFDLKPRWHVFDLIVAAGGLSAKPELITGRIIRSGAQILTLDVAGAMRAPESKANVLLEPNDLVLLDEQSPVHRQVQVIGQVAKPSLYDIEADSTLLSALATAGNPTEHAALTRVSVLRNGKQIPVNLYPFLMEGKADEAVTSFKMQPGDVVFVPTQEARYAVQGQVGKPAYYPFPEKGTVTVLDALNEAGGTGSGGDLSKAGIIRLVDGKYTVLPVNVDQMLKKGDLSKNVALQPGDMLYVPPRSTRQGFSWQNLLAPLSLLGVLGFRL